MLPRDPTKFESLLDVKKVMGLEPNMYKKWHQEISMDFQVADLTLVGSGKAAIEAAQVDMAAL